MLELVKCKRNNLCMNTEIFNRRNISLIAKAVLATLFSLDLDEMEFNDMLSDNDNLLGVLRKVCFESDDVLIKALHELRVTGYLEGYIEGSLNTNYAAVYDSTLCPGLYEEESRNVIEKGITQSLSSEV